MYNICMGGDDGDDDDGDDHGDDEGGADMGTACDLSASPAGVYALPCVLCAPFVFHGPRFWSISPACVLWASRLSWPRLRTMGTARVL